MDPVSMLLMSLIPSGINLAKSAIQGIKANKMAKTTRPEYQIPQAIQEATNNARYQAGMTQLPGQNLMQQKLNQQGAGALANLKDVSSNGAGLGSNIANIYRSNVNAQNDLGIASAQNWNNNQSMLRGQLGQLGQAQNYQFDYNKNQPYQNRMAASSALREGAFRNLSAAGNDIAAAGLGYGNMQAQNPNADVAPMNWDITGGVKGPTGLTKMDMTGALSTGMPSNIGSSTVDRNAIKGITNYSSPSYGANSNMNDFLRQYLLTHPQ
jgi:hypothetical protein